MKALTRRPAEICHQLTTASIVLIVAAVFLSGCTATSGHYYDYDPGPSASTRYYYFPDAHVYYDIHRDLYHYHHPYRGWLKVRTLPHYIHINRTRYHVLYSRHHRPWKDNHAFKHHRSHSDGYRSHEQKKHREKSHKRHDSNYRQTPLRYEAHNKKPQLNHESSNRAEPRVQKRYKDVHNKQHRRNAQRVHHVKKVTHKAHKETYIKKHRREEKRNRHVDKNKHQKRKQAQIKTQQPKVQPIHRVAHLENRKTKNSHQKKKPRQERKNKQAQHDKKRLHVSHREEDVRPKRHSKKNKQIPGVGASEAVDI